MFDMAANIFWETVTQPKYIIAYIVVIVLIMIAVVVSVMINERRFNKITDQLNDSSRKLEEERRQALQKENDAFCQGAPLTSESKFAFG